jgi:MYXO-CTERM domain-containing protein
MRKLNASSFGSIVLAGVLAVACAPLMAASPASDNATNGNFSTGGNGGTGFGPWTINSVGGGNFVNSGSNDATNLPGPVFDIWNDVGSTGVLNTDVTTAIRPFTGALSPGQSFSFSDAINWGNSSNGGGSNMGWSLLDSSGNAIFDFHTGGGFNGYYLTDANNTVVQHTNVQYNYESADHFTFTLNDASGDYTLVSTGASVNGGSDTITGQINMGTGGPAQFTIYDNNGQTNSDVQFNNLAITAAPEPAAFGLAAVGLMAMLRRRK